MERGYLWLWMIQHHLKPSLYLTQFDFEDGWNVQVSKSFQWNLEEKNKLTNQKNRRLP